MQTRVKPRDNTQGIQIPREVLQTANISTNDILDIKVSNRIITLTKPFRHKTLEERMAKYNGQLEVNGEFDRGEPLGEEVW